MAASKKPYRQYTQFLSGRVTTLDTETTGFNHEEPDEEARRRGIQRDRIVEVGAVERNEGGSSGTYHRYVNPERDIPEEATAVHGIRDDDVEYESRFYQIAEEFISFISGSTVVIHNAAFDTGFINMELEHASRKLDKPLGRIEDYCNVVDSLAMAKRLNPCAKKSLDGLCRHFNIDTSSRDLHGALVDSHILMEVYGALVDYEKNHYSAVMEKPWEEDINVRPLRLEKRPRRLSTFSMSP